MVKPLDPYRAKRDFRKTPEPKGKAARSKGDSFVIQKHDATRLHYDLRLEMDGVLKSWAVTKGPSLVPSEKRLAVHTEDHPLDYGSFEGTIPAGEYGGGTVLLWDRGTWRPEFDPHHGYAKGHLNFRLIGEKLGGSWHLVRMKARPKERQEPWLLIKSEDDFARAPDAADILDEAPLSVASGRNLEEIAAGVAKPARKTAARKRSTTATGVAARKGAEKASGVAREVAAPPAPEKGRRTAKAIKSASGSAKLPAGIEPCLATLVDEAPRGAKWLHEIKWDGYRLIAFLDHGKVRLQTRRGHDWTSRFPAIARTIADLDVTTAILDGEAVVEDQNGHSNFSALQQALSDGGDAEAAILYAFDLLHLDGADWRGRPLDERKWQLATLVPADRRDAVRLSDHVDDDGPAMVRHACRLGMEGIISKRRDLPYRSGRNGDWTKSKCTERQEFVIAGFAPSTALKNAVGSLVLGYHQGGGLRHAGRTGTGFTADLARDLHKRLNPLRRKDPPFSDKLTALQRRDAVWVEPRLVGEVEFRGWTGDAHVRHAAFKGLRDDKDAAEVVRETAMAVEAGPTAKTTARKPVAGKAGKPAAHGTATVAGVSLTHPDRVLWEDDGITKQGLAEFYEEIAGWLLPHVVNRPLALVRCPSGSQKGCFFQKHAWAGLTNSIRRDTVRDEDGEEEVLYVEDLKGVVALVQAGVLEIHPWGAPIDDVERPDRVILDLDPGDGIEWAQIIEGAEEARERLKSLRLESFVKTTGGKGLHVVVPLTPKAGWDEVKAFAKRMADQMAADRPDRYTATSVKRERQGRIYVDYLRNGRGATAVAPYSTRARSTAPVAVPIAWNELSPALKPNQFTVANLPARLARLKQDPWKEIFMLKQALPALSGMRSEGRRDRPPRLHTQR